MDQNVAKGWVTDVLSKQFGRKGTFLISVARRCMFSEFTYCKDSIKRLGRLFNF